MNTMIKTEITEDDIEKYLEDLRAKDRMIIKAQKFYSQFSRNRSAFSVYPSSGVVTVSRNSKQERKTRKRKYVARKKKN